MACRSSLQAGTLGRITYFFVLDFARPTRRAVTVARMYDSDGSCASLSPPVSGERLLPRGLTRLEVADFRGADVNGDGADDLVAQVQRAHVPPSAALDRRVAAACKGNAAGNASSVLPPPTTTRLELVNEGASFVPTDATKHTLDAWLAEEGDPGGLSQAAPPSDP